ncbi:MAG TPA: inositol monophosphatase [Sedimentisphaerales bacterium]|nr:inositol monophosphatase [Sedimentisphaerales bacterium]
MTLEHSDLRKMLETAVVASRLAGQTAMEELGFLKVSKKNDNELVTQADIKCQQIIIDRIKETYPDHGFIAEEGEKGRLFKQPPRGSGRLWWVIDPIDGTNNFAHGMLLFAVSTAVMYEGQPIVGVIFEPATESMFTAVAGGHAELNGRRITAGNEPLNTLSGLAVDSHFDDGVPQWVCELMQRTKYRNLGSAALQFAYVAKGGLAGSITSCAKLWDVAAAAVIAQAAQAVVTDWTGGKLFPADLDGYEGQELKVIIANKKVHPELQALLAR